MAAAKFQYGIKTIDSKRPIYIIGPWETLAEFKKYMHTARDDFGFVTFNVFGGYDGMINVNHIIAVCGPGNPTLMEAHY